MFFLKPFLKNYSASIFKQEFFLLKLTEMSEIKISADMKVEELLRHYPKLAQVFRRLKMDCPGCKGSANETIAQVAQNYGRTPDEMVKILQGHLKKAR